LFKLGNAYPILAELENGNWVVVAGAVDGEEKQVRVLDPLAPDRNSFC
jgi:subfamily B ATP-binding cassette protein HlyB/CyaB